MPSSIFARNRPMPNVRSQSEGIGRAAPVPAAQSRHAGRCSHCGAPNVSRSGMEELFAFICSHCGGSVSVEQPEVRRYFWGGKTARAKYVANARADSLPEEIGRGWLLYARWLRGHRGLLFLSP